MIMRNNRAAAITLLLLTAFMGIIEISLISNNIYTDKHAGKVLMPDTTIDANSDTIIPEWDEMLFGTFFINSTTDISDTPDYSLPLEPGNGMELLEGLSGPIYYPGNSTNATNLNPQFKLNFVESFNISVNDTGGNLSARYYPSLGRILKNLQYIKIYNENYTRLYIGRNVSTGTENITRPDHWFKEKIIIFDAEPVSWIFNMSQCVQLMEGTDAYNGSNYVVEISYFHYVDVLFNPPETVNTFYLEGNQTEQKIDYQFSFRFDSLDPISASFIYLPADSDKISSPSFGRFYDSNSSFIKTESADKIDNYTGEKPAWYLQGSYYPIDPQYYLQFNCSMNYTIEFTNIYTDRWTCDRLTYLTYGRRRTLSLNITDGPETMLVRNIRFNLTNIDFQDYYNMVSHSGLFDPITTPYTGNVVAGNNTYKVYEGPIGGPFDWVANGTFFKIDRMQKSQGVMLLDFWYEASQNFTLRITDEVNNPLPGARVYMYYQGKPFGAKMSENDSIIYPPKTSNNLGFVELKNIPTGEYDLEIFYDSQIVGIYSFSTHDLENGQRITISTSVPYQPTILIGWIIVCSIIFVVGIYYLRKKKNR